MRPQVRLAPALHHFIHKLSEFDLTSLYEGVILWNLCKLILLHLSLCFCDTQIKGSLRPEQQRSSCSSRSHFPTLGPWTQSKRGQQRCVGPTSNWLKQATPGRDGGDEQRSWMWNHRSIPLFWNIQLYISIELHDQGEVLGPFLGAFIRLTSKRTKKSWKRRKQSHHHTTKSNSSTAILSLHATLSSSQAGKLQGMVEN